MKPKEPAASKASSWSSYVGLSELMGLRGTKRANDGPLPGQPPAKKPLRQAKLIPDSFKSTEPQPSKQMFGLEKEEKRVFVVPGKKKVDAQLMMPLDRTSTCFPYFLLLCF